MRVHSLHIDFLVGTDSRVIKDSQSFVCVAKVSNTVHIEKCASDIASCAERANLHTVFVLVLLEFGLQVFVV